MIQIWLYLLLTASFAFTILTLIGYQKPALVRARNRLQVFRQHGMMALLCYLLMAILLSVHVIDRRGYDQPQGTHSSRLDKN